jgi:hypothetical protein
MAAKLSDLATGFRSEISCPDVSDINDQIAFNMEPDYRAV